MAKRSAVEWLGTELRLSVRRTCRVVGLARSSARYTSCRPVDDALRERLRTHAAQRPRYGYRRLRILLQRDGHAVTEYDRKRRSEFGRIIRAPGGTMYEIVEFLVSSESFAEIFEPLIADLCHE